MGYFIIYGFPLYFEPSIPYKWINICKYLLIQLLTFEFCVEFHQNSIKLDIFFFLNLFWEQNYIHLTISPEPIVYQKI